MGSGLLRLLTIQADRQRRSAPGPTPLMMQVMTAVGLGDSRDGWDSMIGWVTAAGKDQVAALAGICLNASDPDCEALVMSEAAKLSATAADTLNELRKRRLDEAAAVQQPDAEVCQVFLYGGLFTNQRFRIAFTAILRQHSPTVEPTLPRRSSICGALEMAASAVASTGDNDRSAASAAATTKAVVNDRSWVPALTSLGAGSPTELLEPTLCRSGHNANCSSYWTVLAGRCAATSKDSHAGAHFNLDWARQGDKLRFSGWWSADLRRRRQLRSPGCLGCIIRICDRYCQYCV